MTFKINEIKEDKNLSSNSIILNNQSKRDSASSLNTGQNDWTNLNVNPFGLEALLPFTSINFFQIFSSKNGDSSISFSLGSKHEKWTSQQSTCTLLFDWNMFLNTFMTKVCISPVVFSSPNPSML